MRFTRRRSSLQSGAGTASANAFPQQIFYDEKDKPIPPYLDVSTEPWSANGLQGEADAAAGGSTQSVLRRVSSFSIMSRVSSHLPHGASSLSLAEGSTGTGPITNPAGHSSSGLSSPEMNYQNSETHTNSEGRRVAIQSPRQGVTENEDNSETRPSWRLRDRMKTVGVGLVMALNVGTDPPDIVKPHPCAKLQCWMDPSSVTRQKAKEKIGERLEAQYARWQQQRAARPLKYRRALDPTVEDVRALCLWLRRQARNERILFHYNGHGVPRPTANGEIWVFDKNHTEYIPLSVSDLRQWMGKPTIVVLDCSSAGILIPVLTTPVQETPPDTPPATPQASSSKPMDVETAASHWVKDTIVLCSTSEGEWLPMHPDYPADIFTSCLTTPIQIALRWFVRRNRHSMGSLNPDAVDAIPGQTNDRKTPLGELNWIFTAVTDSIAWNVLPQPLFQRLFRQDLLVASMFRNFLLADRILKSLNCTPQSYPPLPPGVADHPLWQAWDLACETCLFGLLKDGILGNHVLATTKPKGSGTHTGDDSAPDAASSSPSTPSRPATPQSQQPQQAANQSKTNEDKAIGPASSISSPFFSEQLTAFEIWLEYAERHKDMISELETPEQLPVVLQVLLSQVHRVRALELLRRFLQLGPWAVNLSLSLGIFPYVMKLLQSPEYKSLLVSIWASILKFDPSCQVDLVKDGALPHLIQPLASWGDPQTDPIEAAKQRTLSAFSLAATCYKYPQAQTECLRQNLHGRCVALLTTFSKLEEQYYDQIRLYHQAQQQPNRGQTVMPKPIHSQLLPPTSRLWLCLCLGNMVQKCPPAQQEAYHTNMHICLLARLRDDDAHVRAAAAFGLGCLLEDAPDAPPAIPPAMSLGPGAASQGMQAPSFQAGQQVLVNQQMSANTAPVPPALTASAVLSGGFQPTVGNSTTAGANSTRQHGQPVPMQREQMHLAGQPMRWAAPSLQGGMPQLQSQMGQGGGRLQAPQGNVKPLQPMPPTQGVQNIQQMQSAQPLQSDSLQPHGRPQPLPLMKPAQHQQLPGQQQGIRLGNHLLSSNGSLFQQHTMLPPQGQDRGSPTKGPGRPQMMGNQADQLGNAGPPFSMNSMASLDTQNVPHLRRGPTVYENRRRVELDLSITDSLIKGLSDGSSIVRYESMMALSNLVEKYINAFMVVAERGSTFGSEEGYPNDDIAKGNEKILEIKANVPIPNGLNQTLLDRFASCWHALRSTQRRDPHPAVVDVASAVAGIVNEKVMDKKIAMQVETKSIQESSATGLSGIAEEGSGHLNEHSPSSPQLDSTAGKQPRSDGPSHRLPTAKLPLRRTASEQGGMEKADSRSVLHSAENTLLLSDPKDEMTLTHHQDTVVLPKSTFYSWKRKTFKSNYDEMDEDDFEDRDPLNPNGAARAYRQRRNYLTQTSARKLAEHFVGLQPKTPQKKQELDLLLEDSDGDTDGKDTILKGELKLREGKLLKNNGVKMTSMLKFHSFEDVLMVCDEQDGISIWDYEKGTSNVSFRNGNEKGSRMTSASWVNEQTKSLFYVGCNDGSARLWGNIVDDRGNLTGEYPKLSAAFFAVPDLQTEQGGSGMICEWQQFSGSLIAGGHSKHLRCWDLATEKCSAAFETETKAFVTALTTAWDEDLGALQGYSGMGPDVIVAGHSDGSLKVFDIRSRNALSQSIGRPRRHTKFSEHRGWIVDAFFTSYGGRFEVITGSIAGDIRAWDLRSSSSLRTLEAQRSPMTALSVHNQVPIAATGSHAQFIKILTLDGEALQVVRFHEEMAGHRIGPVSCLEFHKQKLVLAAGAASPLVSIYKPKHSPVK